MGFKFPVSAHFTAMTAETSSKAKSDILTAVLPKSQFLWDVTLCLATDV
jgi:hypothetical protein